MEFQNLLSFNASTWFPGILTSNHKWKICERSSCMAENRKKEIYQQKPIERHDTASWADAQKKKQVSKVLIPRENGVINAKEYVDQNQK